MDAVMLMMDGLVGPRGLKSFTPLAPSQFQEDLIEPSNEEIEEMEKVMGYTDNGSATYLTSQSGCLDFFFQIVPSTASDQVLTLVNKAWKEDPLTTLKLIFHLRGVRETGKSDKLHFYDAATWLYKYHPQTLIANLEKVAPTGYYKDLLELVQRLIEGEEETNKRLSQKEVHKSQKRQGTKRRNVPGPLGDESFEEKGMIEESYESFEEEGMIEESYESFEEEGMIEELDADTIRVDNVPIIRAVKKERLLRTTGYYSRKGAVARAAKEAGTLRPREERVAESLEKGKLAKDEAAKVRKMRRLENAYRAVTKYSDATFRALYDAVANLFAQALAKDMKALQEDQKNAKLSLAAKWCPSLDSSYDERTLLCEAIARKMFPKDSDVDYMQLPQEEYVFRVRDRLRKEVLVPLRKAMQLPEVYMSARKWAELPYNRVASVAMKLYKERFIAHDPERFSAFLNSVESGKSKLAAGALLPHEMLKSAVLDDGDEARVAELQWKQMVSDMKENGTLPSSLSVCDVSGSMHGEPMQVCIALGMLTAELSDEPWKNHVITFSEEPVIHKLQGETLADKYNFTATMDWGESTDLQKVFDRILEVARASNLPLEKMVKRIFVFSDMEFDEARSVERYVYDPVVDHYREVEPVPWNTDYGVISSKFREAGYGEPPQIVFWNLRDSRSTPVNKDQPGVALVSGFSKNLLKVLLRSGFEDMDPMIVMKEAISGGLFDDMKVVD